MAIPVKTAIIPSSSAVCFAVILLLFCFFVEEPDMTEKIIRETKMGAIPPGREHRRQKIAERLKAEKVAAMQTAQPAWLRELKRTMLMPERFLAAVREKGEMLKYVPETLRTEDLCLAAVQQDGRMLEYVPDALKTADLCLLALRQNRDAMRYVPLSLRDQMEKALDDPV